MFVLHGRITWTRSKRSDLLEGWEEPGAGHPVEGCEASAHFGGRSGRRAFPSSTGPFGLLKGVAKGSFDRREENQWRDRL